MAVVGSALEATNFHPGRTGRDHLRVLADTAGVGAQRVDEMLELVGIPAAARKRAGGYSMGMRQRLGLAAAMLGDPQVLILDEPANGLDPEGIRWLRGFLRHLSAQGKTVLISSHMLQEVEQTVDDVVIINNGRLIKQGAMADLHGEAHTIVRTTDLDALAGALRVADVTSQVKDGALLAETHDLRLVGDVALRAGLPIYELRQTTTDLEALFFELTEGTNRNLGDGAWRQRAAAPSEMPSPDRKGATNDQRDQGRVPQVLHHPHVVGHGHRHVRRRGRPRRALRLPLHPATPIPTAPGQARRPATPEQIANSVYTERAEHRLPAHPDDRRHADRLASTATRRSPAPSSARPKRARVMGAKVIALLGIGAIYGLISLAGSIIAGAIVLNARGFDAVPRPRASSAPWP